MRISLLLKSEIMKLKVLITLGVILGGVALAQNIPYSEGTVYICPLATNMEEINPWCDCRIDLKLNETVTSYCPLNGKTYEMTLIITEYEGKEYYAILGFENGGAGVNFKPKADIGGPYEGFLGQKIVFDATASFDENGDPLKYRWDFDGDGVWDTGWLDDPKIENSFDKEFEGNLKLEVSDGMLSDVTQSFLKISKIPTIQPGGQISCECSPWNQWQNKGCGKSDCKEDEMLQERKRNCWPRNCKTEREFRCIFHTSCVQSLKDASQKIVKKEIQGEKPKEEIREKKSEETKEIRKSQIQEKTLVSKRPQREVPSKKFLAAIESIFEQFPDLLIAIFSLFSLFVLLFAISKIKKKKLSRK